MTALSVKEASKTISETEDLIILDTRENVTFAEGFITGSIFIGFNDRFEDWALNLIPSGC